MRRARAALVVEVPRLDALLGRHFVPGLRRLLLGREAAEEHGLGRAIEHRGQGHLAAVPEVVLPLLLAPLVLAGLALGLPLPFLFLPHRVGEAGGYRQGLRRPEVRRVPHAPPLRGDADEGVLGVELGHAGQRRADARDRGAQLDPPLLVEARGEPLHARVALPLPGRARARALALAPLTRGALGLGLGVLGQVGKQKVLRLRRALLVEAEALVFLDALELAVAVEEAPQHEVHVRLEAPPARHLRPGGPHRPEGEALHEHAPRVARGLPERRDGRVWALAKRRAQAMHLPGVHAAAVAGAIRVAAVARRLYLGCAFPLRFGSLCLPAGVIISYGVRQGCVELVHEGLDGPLQSLQHDGLQLH
mmetsp:Transcript_10893/g.33122  ORF Transcript_10893/g.33122 Transcript_10893/m.33122 type:complete len:363 (-) Transcript_10893:1215-2303(-)